MISKGFGFVAFFASAVTELNFCMHFANSLVKTSNKTYISVNGNIPPLVRTFLLLGFSDLQCHFHVLGCSFTFSSRNVQTTDATRYGLVGPGIEFQ